MPEMAPPSGRAHFDTRRAALKGPGRVPGTPATARVPPFGANGAATRCTLTCAWGHTEDAPLPSTRTHSQVERKTPQIVETTARGRQVLHMAPPRDQVGLGPRRAARKGPGRTPRTPAAAARCAARRNKEMQVAEASARGPVVRQIAPPLHRAALCAAKSAKQGARWRATGPRSGSPFSAVCQNGGTKITCPRRRRRCRRRRPRPRRRPARAPARRRPPWR